MIEADVQALLEHLRLEITDLRERQQRHLGLIAKLTRETPYTDELDEARSARSALIAQVGTLRAKLRAWDSVVDQFRSWDYVGLTGDLDGDAHQAWGQLVRALLFATEGTKQP